MWFNQFQVLDAFGFGIGNWESRTNLRKDTKVRLSKECAMVKRSEPRSNVAGTTAFGAVFELLELSSLFVV